MTKSANKYTIDNDSFEDFEEWYAGYFFQKIRKFQKNIKNPASFCGAVRLGYEFSFFYHQNNLK